MRWELNQQVQALVEIPVPGADPVPVGTFGAVVVVEPDLPPGTEEATCVFQTAEGQRTVVTRLFGEDPQAVLL